MLLVALNTNSKMEYKTDIHSSVLKNGEIFPCTVIIVINTY